MKILKVQFVEEGNLDSIELFKKPNIEDTYYISVESNETGVDVYISIRCNRQELLELSETINDLIAIK